MKYNTLFMRDYKYSIINKLSIRIVFKTLSFGCKPTRHIYNRLNITCFHNNPMHLLGLLVVICT